MNTSRVSQGATCSSHLNARSSSSRGLFPVRESGTLFGETEDELRVEDVNEVDDNFLLDDSFPDVDVGDLDVPEVKKVLIRVSWICT